MKTKVFTRLEPKAKSYGFSKEELMTVCESIANGFSSEEQATEEAIDAAIDAVLPFLKLSQSAAHRSYERMKAKFEEEHKPSTTPPSTDPKPQQTPPQQTQKPEDEMPTWFKSFQEKYETDRKATEEKFTAMSREKANEGFMAKALEGLKDVDPKFYSRDLKGRTFESQEQVDAYVTEVTADWTSFCSEKNISAMSQVAPPGSGAKPAKPNENVMARVEARKADEPKSAIKGL